MRVRTGPGAAGARRLGRQAADQLFEVGVVGFGDPGELDADPATVTLEQAPAHEAYSNFLLIREYLLPSQVPDILEDTINGATLQIAKQMDMQVTGGSFSIRATGQPIMAPLGVSIIACTTLVTTTCWWLAFFMPDAYRRVVLGSESSDSSENGRASGSDA